MIHDNFQNIKSSIPNNVTLVAVSKFQTVEAITCLYTEGQRIFGENRPQEMVAKQALLPHDIQWHQIGHMQSNKVRMIMPFVAMIHSVDSLELLRFVGAEAVRIGRRVDVLLQVHVAREESKHGFGPEQLLQHLSQGMLDDIHGVNIVGLMAMATFTDDMAVVRAEFERVHQLYLQMQSLAAQRPAFSGDGIRWLSMGMSGDYRLAVECGSNMVRVGSLLFGA